MNLIELDNLVVKVQGFQKKGKNFSKLQFFSYSTREEGKVNNQKYHYILSMEWV